MAGTDRWAYGKGTGRPLHLAKKRPRWQLLVGMTTVFLMVASVAFADQFQSDNDTFTSSAQTGALDLNLDPGEIVNRSIGARVNQQGQSATFPVAVTVSLPAAQNTDGILSNLSAASGNVTGYGEAGQFNVTVDVTAPDEDDLACEEENLFSGRVQFSTTASNVNPSSVHVDINVSVQGGDCEEENSPPVITSAAFASGTVACPVDSVTPNATLNVSFTDADAGDTHTATVDWGDGSGVENLGTVTSPFSASHHYGAAGMYTATVTVSDGTDSDTETANVTVNFTVVSGGIQAPLTGTQNNATIPVFNSKSTLPIKVELQDCDGSFPPGLAPELRITKVSSDTPDGVPAETVSSTSGADTGMVLRESDPIHIYNLALKSLTDLTATYRVRVYIAATGQIIGPSDFGVKK